MRAIAIDPHEPRQDRVDLAAAALRAGGIVALPTETVYGLAADSADPLVLRRVNRLKHKAEDAPLLLLLSDATQAESVAANLPETFYSLAEMFWPGPLTLVVAAAADLPADVSGRRGTVALRVPGLPFPRRLAATLGRPITGVSANRHGSPPCRTAREVAEQFDTGLELILDGGPAPGGRPSTILDLTGERPTILREGLLPICALEPFLSNLAGTTRPSCPRKGP